MSAPVDLVIPTVGRPSLTDLLIALDRQIGADRPRVVVVDDRPDPDRPLDLPDLVGLDVSVVASGGGGPARARNTGWRRCAGQWICFLDDDVVPRDRWWRNLVTDLRRAGPDIAAVQGRVQVPLPSHRAPTDRERNVAGLGGASWITADMAVRRRALVEVGGFDERFTRAYREDTDLALRLLDANWRLTVGERVVEHPVGPAAWTSSIRAQRGNADDALMSRLHGPDWRRRGQAPAGRIHDHLETTALGTAAVLVGITSRRSAATVLGGLWAWRTARFFWDRVATGPRDAAEIARMAITSVVIPPAAVAWRLAGTLRARRLAPGGPSDRWSAQRPGLVLFDRDGTLVEDVPYNGDPAQVRPMSGAREALDRLRQRGIKVGLITNQSGVARGVIDMGHVSAVNARVADLLGPFDTVQVCPHGPDDGCGARKPAAGMVLAAASATGVSPHRCAVVGDIGSDVDAGLAAGARAILVPTPVTLATERNAAPELAQDLDDAVDMLLGEHRLPSVGTVS